MKIRVKFKDPDTMQDAVIDALKQVERPLGVEPFEWEQLKGERAIRITEEITDLWMDDGEYLDVEFDTGAKTAKVLSRGSIP